MSNIEAPSLPSDETQCITYICFGLAGMEEYYMYFKEKQSIHAETEFEASCPLFRLLDKIVWADGMITLDAKIDKDAPALKRAKDTKNRTQPPPSMLSSTIDGQFQVAEVPASTPTDLFKIAQIAQAHESQIVKLAKSIPSMIQQAIKKSMQPARDKLRGRCSTIEVLENDVIAFKKDVDILTRPPPASNPIPPEPVAVTSQPEAPKSPPDDWWAGYDSL
ncbi:hypothetical protein HAX54_044805 [Datura stramonium]|uniref:Uncharacterized protein n=1 Tax=Datura stramonium TaxID=4076 RepID=A0ABS8WF44_DATST|nr:hypothetical protein [Datura stramonium]